MKQFFLNQGFVQSQDVARLGSVKMSWEKAASLWKDHFFVQADLSWMGILLTAVFMMFGVYLCKERYNKILLLCGFMVVIPFWSGGYMLIYMCIPLIVFFRDSTDEAAGIGRYFYAVLFAMIFSMFIYDCPPCGYLFGKNFTMVKSMLAVYVKCAVAAGKEVLTRIACYFRSTASSG
ncbi:hypothetical protein C823_000103 [Eubacterium plexicaudatum ASF492]|uniref:Uncharacterized protein n=1 Tax=Eubacterium plexicaudatum ASF492 TaxID=1235802 RepID=N2A947_9FIRM|nr:hypothetical protein C823_000103 [Eubacterium plexicaudatum ASF492]